MSGGENTLKLNRRNIKTRKSSKRFQNSTQKGDKGHNQAENNNNNG